MKDLKPEQVEDVSGGLDARQYDTQVASEPTSPPSIIDFNPEHPPQ